MAGSEPAQKPRLGKLSEADERRLVDAAQQDRAHFGAVYEKYFEVVYAYVARRVRDRAVTEDLTSEVFRKALAHLPRFKWTGAPFAAWLLRIAANLIADRAKRVAREGHGRAERPPRLAVDQPGHAAVGRARADRAPARPRAAGAIRRPP